MLEVACTALAAAVGEVKGGQTRLRQAEAVLAGPEGLGRWRELHQQLVMRRCHLVSRLAVAYQVGQWVTASGGGACSLAVSRATANMTWSVHCG
jgi:hypothetical protein